MLYKATREELLLLSISALTTRRTCAYSCPGSPKVDRTVRRFGYRFRMMEIPPCYTTPSKAVDKKRARCMVFPRPCRELLLELSTHPLIKKDLEVVVQYVPESFFGMATVFHSEGKTKLPPGIRSTWPNSHLALQRLRTFSSMPGQYLKGQGGQ